MKPIRIVPSDRFHRQLRRLPKHIAGAVGAWVVTVQRIGIRATRQIPGYHDEPLKGKRRGQRSVRLNRSYRLIYEQTEDDVFTIILVLEVHNHEY
ncbi:MAG: type II toxin-antitoxin system RelE/ParE family toxin [Bdellovibrionaceae bacterium]|nr:type II toxin-antitoxin system RelE/ParE family toxin [Pseudobdellovibrionaceae bacterium]